MSGVLTRLGCRNGYEIRIKVFLLWFVLFILVWFVVFDVLFLFCFLRQGFSMESYLSWNSLCRPAWPRNQRIACLCLSNAGIKGVQHHCLVIAVFKKQGFI